MKSKKCVFRNHFIDSKTDKILTKGDILKRKNLAKTLRALQDKGDEGYKEFYGGELGRKVIDELKELGCQMTLKDLEDYK